MTTATQTPKYSVDNIKHLAALLLEWLAIYLAPTISMVGAVGAVVVFDLITGVMAAKKTGTYAGSKGLRRSVPKFAGYAIGILTANLVQNLYFPDFPVVKFVGGFIIWVEVKSINENIEKSTGLNIIQGFFNKLRRFF